MFGNIARHFGIGLVTVLPFAFVIWVVIFVFNVVDGLFGQYVDTIDHVYIPGVGFLLVIIGITLVGALTHLYISRRFLLFVDSLFTRIPFVKSLYSTAKELISNLVGRRQGFHRAVLVNWPDERAQVLGFVSCEHLPLQVDPLGTKIAVYFPNAFQFAGTTVIVDRGAVTACDMTVEEAFSFAVSAGLGQSADIDSK